MIMSWVQCKLCKLEVRMGLLDSVLYTYYAYRWRGLFGFI